MSSSLVPCALNSGLASTQKKSVQGISPNPSGSNWSNRFRHLSWYIQNKLVWVQLDDYKYPRTALYLPQKYRKMALCEAHNNQFGGHNAALKTYIRISSSYFWPKIYTDVLNHTKTCFRCQQRKPSTNKPPLLQPLPIPDRPNIRIHADLFGPMLAAGRQHKYILCRNVTSVHKLLVRLHSVFSHTRIFPEELQLV